MESELRDLGKLDFFGMLKSDSDHEKVMEEIDKFHAKWSINTHHMTVQMLARSVVRNYFFILNKFCTNI